MNKNHRTIWFAAASLLAWTLLSGCFGRSPKVHYYRLQALETNSPEHKFSNKLKIAVGPVSIPEALKRTQIAAQDPSGSITFSEYNRWAGPLPEEIAAVLAENIAVLLGSHQVVSHAQEGVLEPSHRMVVSISHFERRIPKELVLEAVWSIKAEKTNQPLTVRRSNIREPLQSESYEEIVQAHSRALRTMAREMGQAVVENIGSD